MGTIGAPIPVEITPQIIDLARWAVNEHNKQEKTSLIFTRVWSASDEHMVEGVKYYLWLQAADGDIIGWRINTYHAQVFVKAGWSVNELLLFVRMNRAS